MGKSGPETALVEKMRKAGREKYGDRLVIVKYHGSEYSEAGVSDLLCLLDGVFIAAEVKSPESAKHKRATVEASIKHALEHGPTKKQRAFLNRVIKAGGIGGVVADVEGFMTLLVQAELQAWS